MNPRIFYAVALGAAIVAALFAFLPTIRHLLWLGIFWGIMAVSVIAVVGVIGNIVSVMFSMYTGYSSAEQTDKVERRVFPPPPTGETPVALGAVKATTDNVLPFSLAAATGEEVVEQRLDAIGQLYRAERALSNLQSSRVFQAFSDSQKYEYFQVLGDVRSLIRDISKQSVESKVASEVSLLQNTTRTHITKNLMTASSNLRLRSGLRH